MMWFRNRWVTAIVVCSILASCDEALPPGPDDPADPEPPVEPEPRPAVLHAAWISMSPQMPAPGPEAPRDAGWPDVGQTIEWVCHLYNSGDETVEAVPYEWLVDETQVAEGIVDLPPGETTVSLDRSWSSNREQIEFVIDPPELPADDRHGHSLAIESDALTVGLWINVEIAEFMERHSSIPPFPVWAGREVQVWNSLFAAYQSSSQPHEILDRIRLEAVRIVRADTNWPEVINSDMFWWYNGHGDRRFLSLGSPSQVFQDQTITLHELVHHRGVHDLYAYRVWHGRNGSQILIKDPNGAPAVGGSRMPYRRMWPDGGEVFSSPYMERLMGADYSRPTRIDPLTAYGLNWVAGRRTPRWKDEWGNHMNGFTCSPVQYDQHNAFVLDVPDSARIQFLVDGEPAPVGTNVEVFFDHAGETYHNLFLEEPDQTAAVGADHKATIDIRYLQSLPPDAVWDSDVVIVRVTVGSRWGYSFLPVYELNMAYVRGQRVVADLDIEVDVR